MYRGFLDAVIMGSIQRTTVYPAQEGGSKAVNEYRKTQSCLATVGILAEADVDILHFNVMYI